MSQNSNQVIQRIQTLEAANSKQVELIQKKKQEIQWLQEENRRLEQQLAAMEQTSVSTVA